VSSKIPWRDTKQVCNKLDQVTVLTETATAITREWCLMDNVDGAVIQNSPSWRIFLVESAARKSGRRELLLHSPSILLGAFV
jgi:hypothetical protein